MPDNELVLLDRALEELQATLPESTSESHAFEVMACTLALRDKDLSAEEIQEGIVGGGNDGAIDGVYVFLRDSILAEDSQPLQDEFIAARLPVGTTLELFLVQAKRTKSFSETAIDLASDSTRRLLDLSESEDDLEELYSPALLSRVGLFRSALRKFGGRHLNVEINFYYASRGSVSDVGTKVLKKRRDLESQLDRVIVKGRGSVTLLGSKELWERYSTVPTYTLKLTCQEYSTRENSHVALVTLRDYISFLRDETGSLQRHIFDWNVRDYQGDVEVNREIRKSIMDAGLPEFWWLNNGVTIVCSTASITSKTFWLDDVQVVNGLQTSQTVFYTLADEAPNHPAFDRCILVRILAIGDDAATRDQVIRATNHQTAVPAASLRATDHVQRKIEAYFADNDWYYDRRKNYYRNQGKPASHIIGIALLAQAVMAMGLSQPNSSRARPSSLIKSDSDYQTVFDPKLPLATYLWLAKTQKAVDAFLLTDDAATNPSERTNLRFHLAMLAVATLHGSRVYSPSQLSTLVAKDVQLDGALLSACLAALRERFEVLTVNDSADRVAKGREMVEDLLDVALPRTLNWAKCHEGGDRRAS